MKEEHCIRAIRFIVVFTVSIVFVTFLIFCFSPMAMADILTADPQPSKMVTKYQVKINGEVFPAEIKAMEGDQVRLLYNIDHLAGGQHSAFARAGNDSGGLSAWSEELIFFRRISAPQNVELYCVGGVPDDHPKRLPQNGFTVYHVSSQQGNGYSGEKAVDNGRDTFWHTGSRERPAHPHEIQIDLGKIYTVSGFWQQPRMVNANLNCMILAYKFYVSMDGTEWAEVAFGKFPGSQIEHFVSFAPCQARYVSLVALSSTGKSCTAVSEINILGY